MGAPSDRTIIETSIARFIEVVKTECGATAIYLFGSYVRGDFTDNSDIDIAVVGENFSGDAYEDTLMLMRKRRNIDSRIEPHPFTVKDFDLSNPYVKEIVDTGIRLM